MKNRTYGNPSITTIEYITSMGVYVSGADSSLDTDEAAHHPPPSPTRDRGNASNREITSFSNRASHKNVRSRMKYDKGATKKTGVFIGLSGKRKSGGARDLKHGSFPIPTPTPLRSRKASRLVSVLINHMRQSLKTFCRGRTSGRFERAKIADRDKWF